MERSDTFLSILFYIDSEMTDSKTRAGKAQGEPGISC